ncbi:MAG: Rap1a/Tai family immunity protein, partial [Terracidiphilus sp.]
NAPEDSAELAKGMHCLGYLSGVTDTYLFWKYTNNTQKAKVYVPACIPEGATNFELARVVVKYLNDHPNQLHKSYRLLVMLALEDAYPCKY